MTAQTHFHNGPQDYPQPDWNNYRVRAVTTDARPWPPAPADIKSILIIKLDAMGDYLLHTPFYASLRKFYPQAKITLLCNKNNLNLAEHNPAFDYVITPPYEPGYDQAQSFLYAIELQAHAAAPFDLIIVPRWTEDWHHAGVITQVLDAPYRLSYSGNTNAYKAQHFPQHEDFFTHVIDDARPAHEVWRGMQILHALGMKIPPVADIKQEFHFTAEDENKIKTLLAVKHYPRPWFVFGVGASADHKRWPAEHFAELAHLLQDRHGGTIFMLGHGKKDELAAETILAAVPQAVNFVDQLTPRESGVFARACDIMVCNDSFALHAAATAGTPAVEITGHPANGDKDSEYLPWRFGPWGIPFAWLQPETCHHSGRMLADFRLDPKCIGDIPASDVCNAVTQGLHRWPKSH